MRSQWVGDFVITAGEIMQSPQIYHWNILSIKDVEALELSKTKVSFFHLPTLSGAHNGRKAQLQQNQGHGEGISSLLKDKCLLLYCT